MISGAALGICIPAIFITVGIAAAFGSGIAWFMAAVFTVASVVIFKAMTSKHTTTIRFSKKHIFANDSAYDLNHVQGISTGSAGNRWGPAISGEAHKTESGGSHQLRGRVGASD